MKPMKRISAILLNYRKHMQNCKKRTNSFRTQLLTRCR
ncbi:Uncharacterised protein [Mycobacterium tuberculosis]|nr:Uncharacterised protein [Mycobacterium tuberculosis]